MSFLRRDATIVQPPNEEAPPSTAQIKTNGFFFPSARYIYFHRSYMEENDGRKHLIAILLALTIKDQNLEHFYTGSNLHLFRQTVERLSTLKDGVNIIQQIDDLYPDGGERTVSFMKTFSFKQKKPQQKLTPFQVTTQFLAVALYEIVVLLDDSGSMKTVDQINNVYLSRIKQLEGLLRNISGILGLLDQDGYDVRFFNNDRRFDNVTENCRQAAPPPSSHSSSFFRRSKNKMPVAQLASPGPEETSTISEVVDNLETYVLDTNLTPMGESLLSRVIEPYFINPANAGKLLKPVLGLILTDGIPYSKSNDPSELHSIHGLRRLKEAFTKLGAFIQQHQEKYGRKPMSIGITQVGLDEGAQNLIRTCDSDPTFGRLLDGTSLLPLEEIEIKAKLGAKSYGKNFKMSYAEWLVKFFIGPINRSMDGIDETGAEQSFKHGSDLPQFYKDLVWGQKHPDLVRIPVTLYKAAEVIVRKNLYDVRFPHQSLSHVPQDSSAGSSNHPFLPSREYQNNPFINPNNFQSPPPAYSGPEPESEFVSWGVGHPYKK